MQNFVQRMFKSNYHITIHGCCNHIHTLRHVSLGWKLCEWKMKIQVTTLTFTLNFIERIFLVSFQLSKKPSIHKFHIIIYINFSLHFKTPTPWKLIDRVFLIKHCYFRVELTIGNFLRETPESFNNRISSSKVRSTSKFNHKEFNNKVQFQALMVVVKVYRFIENPFLHKSITLLVMTFWYLDQENEDDESKLKDFCSEPNSFEMNFGIKHTTLHYCIEKTV